jgi:hypothetical protein
VSPIAVSPRKRVLHLSDAERFPAAGLGDRIVQVEDVDPIEACTRRQRTMARIRAFVGMGGGYRAAADTAGNCAVKIDAPVEGNINGRASR